MLRSMHVQHKEYTAFPHLCSKFKNKTTSLNPKYPLQNPCITNKVTMMQVLSIKALSIAHDSFYPALWQTLFILTPQEDIFVCVFLHNTKTTTNMWASTPHSISGKKWLLVNVSTEIRLCCIKYSVEFDFISVEPIIIKIVTRGFTETEAALLFWGDHLLAG